MTIDVTFGRAFRVWWSYTWRSIVLSTFVMVQVQILVIAWIVPPRSSGGCMARTGSPLNA
jgi:hypothetical protein